MGCISSSLASHCMKITCVMITFLMPSNTRLYLHTISSSSNRLLSSSLISLNTMLFLPSVLVFSKNSNLYLQDLIGNCRGLKRGLRWEYTHMHPISLHVKHWSLFSYNFLFFFNVIQTRAYIYTNTFSILSFFFSIKSKRSLFFHFSIS